MDLDTPEPGIEKIADKLFGDKVHLTNLQQVSQDPNFSTSFGGRETNTDWAQLKLLLCLSNPLPMPTVIIHPICLLEEGTHFCPRS